MKMKDGDEIGMKYAHNTFLWVSTLTRVYDRQMYKFTQCIPQHPPTFFMLIFIAFKEWVRSL